MVKRSWGDADWIRIQQLLLYLKAIILNQCWCELCAADIPTLIRGKGKIGIVPTLLSMIVALLTNTIPLPPTTTTQSKKRPFVTQYTKIGQRMLRRCGGGERGEAAPKGEYLVLCGSSEVDQLPHGRRGRLVPRLVVFCRSGLYCVTEQRAGKHSPISGWYRRTQNRSRFALLVGSLIGHKPNYAKLLTLYSTLNFGEVVVLEIDLSCFSQALWDTNI